MITTYNTLPTNCEFCGAELEWDSVNLVCSNPYCSNVAEEQLKAWITNIAPVDGIGWKTIKKCLDISPWISFPIHTLKDLYKVVNNPLARNHHVKLNSEADLFNKVLDKLGGQITISQFLLALKIPGLGKIGAKKVEDAENAKIAFESILCSKYDNTINFDYDLGGSDNIWAKLLQDKNVAESLYTKYRQYFINCYNLVKNQIIFDGVVDKEIVNKGNVVITGTLSIKRSEFIKELEENGWKVENKISKNTNYLITNTPDSGTSKNKEADKLGVTKITESDFIRYVM